MSSLFLADLLAEMYKLKSPVIKMLCTFESKASPIESKGSTSVSQFYMLLCPCVYGLQQYGDLNNSCPLCFLFYSVSKFKIKKIKGTSDVS